MTRVPTDGRPAADGGRDRPLRTAPHHDRQLAMDAAVHENHGWAVPAWYGDSERFADEYELPDGVDEPAAVGIEHLATRATVGCYDLTPHQPVEIRGPASESYMTDTFTTALALAVGGVGFTLLLAESGGIIADLIVARLAEERYLAVASPGAEGVVEALLERAGSGVAVAARDDAYVGLGLWGPKARALAGSTTPADLSDDGFPFFTARELRLGGVPVVALRLSAVGELGWELWTPTGHAAALWDAIWDAGCEHGLVGLGDEAFTRMTAEKGHRELDLDPTHQPNPFEAGLAAAVDLDTEFVGRDALERLAAEGHDREQAILTVDAGTPVPPVGATVRADGRALGEVIRSEFGYSIDASIAFSYLPVEYVEAGTDVDVEVGADRHAATVREAPLFDPTNERLRG